MKFLFAISDSTDAYDQQRVRGLEDNVKDTFVNSQFDAQTILFPSLEAIMREFANQKKSEIGYFHFWGRGKVNSVELFEKRDWENTEVKGQSFASYLGMQKSLKLVAFSTPNSIDTAQNAVNAGLAAAIGTKGEVMDFASLKFYQAFWQQLIAQNSVQKAFELAMGEYKAMAPKDMLPPPAWELILNLRYKSRELFLRSQEQKSENPVQAIKKNTQKIKKNEGIAVVENNGTINANFTSD